MVAENNVVKTNKQFLNKNKEEHKVIRTENLTSQRKASGVRRPQINSQLEKTEGDKRENWMPRKSRRLKC